MKTEDIVKVAKERLTEIEAEAVKLRAMIAAAKGPSIPTHVPVPPPIEVCPFVFPFAQESSIEYEWVRKPRKYKMTPSWQSPFDLLRCEETIEIGRYNGVYPTLNGVVIGGPQRMDQNVRFAGGASDGGYASLKT